MSVAFHTVTNMLHIKALMLLNASLSVKKNLGFTSYYSRDVERLRRFFFWSSFTTVVRLNPYAPMDPPVVLTQGQAPPLLASPHGEVHLTATQRKITFLLYGEVGQHNKSRLIRK